MWWKPDAKFLPGKGNYIAKSIEDCKSYMATKKEADGTKNRENDTDNETRNKSFNTGSPT